MSFTNLETVLDVATTDPIQIETSEPINDGFDANVNTDYESSRNKLYKLSDSISHLLNDAILSAIQSGEPRSYEAAAMVAKVALETDQSISKLNLEQKKLKEQPKEAKNATTNNNIFVGSTAELQKFIRIQANKK